MAKAKLQETDLYEPVKDYLTGLGYAVFAEVGACDVAAVKDETLVVVELKLSLTVPLLVQAVGRQKAADCVYVAVPRPKRTGRSWLNQRGVLHLLKRLELGLLLVSWTRGKPRVQAVLHPPEHASTSPRGTLKKALFKEMEGRSGDYNIGGTTRQKLMTAYREQAIHVACCLQEMGPSSAKTLRTRGTSDKTYAILSDNYYGWFTKVGRGVYALTDAGHNALVVHSDVATLYQVGYLDGHQERHQENMEEPEAP